MGNMAHHLASIDGGKARCGGTIVVNHLIANRSLDEWHLKGVTMEREFGRVKERNRMFAAYTTLDKCISKEIRVLLAGEEYVGMLTGVYSLYGQAVLVITPLGGDGVEQHIPIVGAVVTVKQ
jgi:hypothetical protein